MAFVFGLVAGLATTAAASVLLALGVGGRDPTLRWGGLLLFSLALFQASLLVPGSELPYLLSALAGMVYMAWAPPFYHRFLGISMTPWTNRLYCALWGGFVALTVLGWDSSRFPSLLPAILVLYFGMVAWGLVLVGWRLRSPVPVDRLTRRFLKSFALVGLVSVPFIVVDSWGTTAGWPWLSSVDNLSLPVFLLVLDGLVLGQALRWTATPRPPLVSETEPLPSPLTPRETEIARWILEGASAKEIASALDLSPKTVENHTYRIYQKLGAKSRLQFYHKYREPPIVDRQSR